MPGMRKDTGAGFREKQQQLNTALKNGSFTHIYLLYGEQAYLRNQNRDKLREALMQSENGFAIGGDGSDSLNYTIFRGAEFTSKQVIELAETLPFFAERRVILFESTGLFKDRSMNSVSEELADYFGSQPETTYFVFSEPAIDRNKRIYKAITSGKKGADATVLNVDEIRPEDITNWTAQLFRKEGRKIGSGVLNLFLQYTGTDMYNIISEKEKLLSYIGDADEVKAQDIRDVCTPVIKDRIFDMINAIAGRDTGKATSIYMDLIKNETPPQIILSLMTNQYCRMMQVKDLEERGFSAEGIGSATGIPGWMITKNYIPVCRKYRTAREIENEYARCVKANSDYKSGKVSDRLAVEILLCGRDRD